MATATTQADGSLLIKTTSAKARQGIYVAYSALGVALGGIQVAYSAANAGQPVWLTVALAVFAFLGTSLGITAASNITKTTVPASSTSPAVKTAATAQDASDAAQSQTSAATATADAAETATDTVVPYTPIPAATTAASEPTPTA